MDSGLPMRNDQSDALRAKVAFLGEPTSYPDHPRRVERLETHMSWVFLTERHVYKLKKPVKFPFLDFSSREARRRSCEAEVQLNRRLAKDTYLGTVAITQDKAGILRLDGDGEPVDWLVKMRRLPAQRMLDIAIRNESFAASDIERVATVLSEFYLAVAPVEMPGAAYRAQFREWIDSNHAVLRDPDFSLPQDAVVRVNDRQHEFLDDRADGLDQRAAQNRIIEAHGDLRPEHIYLGPPPQIIDCLEFNRAFRILDPADELSFLSMECAFLGAPCIERILFDTYCQVTGDSPPTDLIAFYKCYRACLRAKLSVWHVSDPHVDDNEKWIRRGQQYLDLANRYAHQLA